MEGATGKNGLGRAELRASRLLYVASPTRSDATRQSPDSGQSQASQTGLLRSSWVAVQFIYEARCSKHWPVTTGSASLFRAKPQRFLRGRRSYSPEFYTNALARGRSKELCPYFPLRLCAKQTGATLANEGDANCAVPNLKHPQKRGALIPPLAVCLQPRPQSMPAPSRCHSEAALRRGGRPPILAFRFRYSTRRICGP